MKKSLLCIAVAAVALTAASSVEAAQGCGIGWHRGYYGRCLPNRGPVVAGPWRLGVYYPGRGWWYGHRFWWHRYRWHGGWRYR